MIQKNWKTYAFWIGLSEAVGLIAAFLIRDSVDIYAQTILKPPLSPPAWVFPVAWTVLYALMGIAAARLRMEGRQKCVNLFITQLIVNFFWPLFFFNLQVFGFALVWLLLLWVLVLLLVLCARKTDIISGWFLAPYLLWLTFALYLNAGVWLLN